MTKFIFLQYPLIGVGKLSLAPEERLSNPWSPAIRMKGLATWASRPPLVDPRMSDQPCCTQLGTDMFQNSILLRSCYPSIFERITGIRERCGLSGVVLTGQPGTGLSLDLPNFQVILTFF